LPSPAQLEELLRFYAEAGYDDAILDEPVDRFAETAAARPLPAPEQPARRSDARPGLSVPPVVRATPAPATIAVPDGEQAQRARALAQEAKTLDELREIIAGFDGCNLKLTAKSTVFADGN